MDDRTGKHSSNGLRTNVQRTTANIPVGEIEKLLLSDVFLLLLSQQYVALSSFSSDALSPTPLNGWME
jgi:hypothetical protein